MDNIKSTQEETEIKVAADSGGTGDTENPAPPGETTENTVPSGDDTENADVSEDDAETTADSGDYIADQDASVATSQQKTTAVSDEEVKDLVAVYPILYLSHQYKVGDRLPANNPEMVQAWLDAGTAAWSSARVESPKANLKTAEPGLPGQSVYQKSQDGDDLAGKISRTRGRRR